MSDKKETNNLKESLFRLEKAAQKIVSTRGYTKEVENIKMLNELIREQLINENISYSTRKIR
ncbi:MAG: hypothetical protein KDD58_07770 [Bdellovibrionales bacterium]|nr:hypothetical protein [Bdellovibrionales bacterium]